MYKLQSLCARFEDGYLTARHKHNYVELTYVIDGAYHQRIEGAMKRSIRARYV
ncbi:MAG: hypothetical protein LBL45_01215 [Treponema sp.]|jgi:anti-sigma factor ChrR (cupin superfamily)|nr:hypothetical protein [Treponema sp.]